MCKVLKLNLEILIAGLRMKKYLYIWLDWKLKNKKQKTQLYLEAYSCLGNDSKKWMMLSEKQCHSWANGGIWTCFNQAALSSAVELKPSVWF